MTSDSHQMEKGECIHWKQVSNGEDVDKRLHVQFKYYSIIQTIFHEVEKQHYRL